MDYKCKIITEEQMDEIQMLANMGHGDAIKAYGVECVSAYKEGMSKGTVKAIALSAGVMLLAGIGIPFIFKDGKKVVHKYKVRKVKQK